MSYSHRPQGPPPPGPPLPPGWHAEWAAQEQRYIFINQYTGERSWNHPGAGQGQGHSYGAPQPPQPQQKNHTLLAGGVGAAAGLLGGAFLMHEKDKRMVPGLVLPE